MQTILNITRLRSTVAPMLLLGALAVGGFSACSKSEEPLRAGQPVEITPTAVFQQGTIEATDNRALTKAPVDGSAQMTLYFVRADETSAGNYGSYGTSALTATRAAGSGATDLTFATKQFYQTNGLKTKLTGWYPQATTFASGAAKWTLDGSQDLLIAAAQEGSTATAMPGFTFNHQLAQLQFFPYADNNDIPLSWGKITKIEVLTQANQATHTLSTGAVTFSGSATFSAGIAASGVALATSKNDAAMVGNAVMIAPQSSATYTLTLSITTEKQGVKTVTLTQKFEAGIPYKIYLRFVMLEMNITPDVAIGDWIEQNINVEY